MPLQPATSYHTHNAYCDGAGTIEEIIQAAMAAGIREIGISSHAPLPFPTEWAMPSDRLAEYVSEVRSLAGRYQHDITVLLGAEIDYIPDPAVEAFQEESVFPLGFDYFVGSVHFLGSGYPPGEFDGTEARFQEILRDDFRDSIEAMVAEYYARMRRSIHIPGVRIVGHLDRIKRWNASQRYFTEREPWYRAAVTETLAAIAKTGQILELNTGAWRRELPEPYPSVWILAEARALGIPICLSSDSHSPAEVDAGFDRGRAILEEIGAEAVVLPR